MSNDLDVSIAEVLRRAMRAQRADIHTMLPGKIKSWDATANVADIELQIDQRVYLDDDDAVFVGSYEQLPILPAVPIVWPRTGSYVLTMPLSAGDGVMVVFSEASIGEYRTTGQRSQPADDRRHSIGYPVAVPGLFADVSQMSGGDAGARASSLVLGRDGASTQIRIDGSGINLGTSATSAAAKASQVDLIFTALSTMCAALTTYVQAIQPTADPLNSATPALVTAISTFTATITSTAASLVKVQ